jgi:hypothetical protein
MRKALGIMIGCIVLCGLVMAVMLALPPPTNTIITIDGDLNTDGVDTPWFELSKSAKDTIQWKNVTQSQCQIEFGAQSPFAVDPITIDANGGVSAQYEPTKAPGPPQKAWPKGKVYRVYKYKVVCGNTTFDPGGGIFP